MGVPLMGFGISIQIIYQEDDSNGDICNNCEFEIVGKRYVMMLQIGEAMNAKPLNYQLCRSCYITVQPQSQDDQPLTDNI